VNGGDGLGKPGHGERSASEADAKKDRESVGQTPANTAHAPFPASGKDFQSGRWGAHVGSGLDDGFGLGRDGRSRAQRGTAGLPCLNSNNSIGATLEDALHRLSAGHRKTAFALTANVQRLSDKYGIERIGVFTPTFADHVTCPKEAGRRYNSLNVNVLSKRYAETIAVLERMKSGRIHFHLLVVLPVDIRTGCNFKAIETGDYSSANEFLRAEWKFWRETAKRYGFGRTELLPVKSTEEAIAKYVGKYIAKHIGQRENRDKGVRLVRYSRGAKAYGTRFSFGSLRGRLWRWQLAEFARLNGGVDEAAVRGRVGESWGYHQRARIMSIEPPELVVAMREVEGEPDQPVTLRNLFDVDRFFLAASVARHVGCTREEAWTALFQPRFAEAAKVEFTVPKCTGKRIAGEDFSDAVDMVTLWNNRATGSAA
jgi:hypothetical protein